MAEGSLFDIELCTPLLREAFLDAIRYAEKEKLEFVTPELILYHIVTRKEFTRFSKNHGFDCDGFARELDRYIQDQDRSLDDQEYCIASSAMLLVFRKCKETVYEEAAYYDDEITLQMLNTPEFLFGMYELDKDTVARYLLGKYLGEGIALWYGPIQRYYECPKNLLVYTKDQNRPQELNGCRFIHLETDRFRMILDQITEVQEKLNQEDSEYEETGYSYHEPWEDLVTSINDVYKHKNPLIGRKKELERCIRILCRKDKNNPLFIGEPGVGKTALIYGLARMIAEDDVPSWLKKQNIYSLDMASMMAGASYHGEFEKRMKMVLDGARKKGDCIIYIDEIHTICDNGGNQSMTAGDILKPYLEDGTIRFIGSTTYQEYNKHMAGKKAIARRFAQIDVREPDVKECIEIITALLPYYEKHHGVKYDDDAVTYAVEQSDALIHDRFLPDKAIDIIDEAGAYLQQHPLLNKNGEQKQTRFQKVDKGIIRTILTDVCRIDAKALASESNSSLKDLDTRISKDIYGQDEAIRQVVRSVMMSKAGLMEADKPIASLLFVGPTGVGKTEVCKVLARELGIELVRFDMSEYTEKHTISKLIGSPAGYVGYDDGGLLTDAIRKTPNCVLLLDEIEKAHEDIYNILLQVMDYARLTDNKGNRADFRNVILVMTSNAGAQYAGQASVGFGGGQSKGQAMLSSVRKTFKPEFLNRLSGTVVFNDMDRTMASLILDKKLRQLSVRLSAKNVTMGISDDARELLLEKGYSTQYGAREMDRVIQQELTPLLMESILFGKLTNGGEASITRKDDGLQID